jgi:formate C-acetyltransferase
MLRSTANLDQSHAPGTLVVNIRLARSHFQSTSQREKLRALVESYFALGGLQLQINVIDQAMLESAVEHPERYGDLVVRVGGYSEYWRNLEPALRQSVLLRTEH